MKSNEFIESHEYMGIDFLKTIQLPRLLEGLFKVKKSYLIFSR